METRGRLEGKPARRAPVEEARYRGESGIAAAAVPPVRTFAAARAFAIASRRLSRSASRGPR